MDKIDRAQRGAHSELKAATALMEEGYHVFRAVAPHAPFDLVIVHKKTGEMQRVEVRTGHLKGKRISFSVYGEYDRLVVVCNEDGRVFTNVTTTLWADGSPVKDSVVMKKKSKEQMLDVQCPGCGKTFRNNNLNRIYCCVRCNALTWKRNKAKEAGQNYQKFPTEHVCVRWLGDNESKTQGAMLPML